MGVLVQIRDVPEDVYRVLKVRAVEAGQSYSEFLRAILTQAATRPPMAEMVRRLETRGRLTDLDSTADDVRELREAE
jgi:antitoxin FitA